jgi:anti-sigma factor RsiW
MTYGSGRDSEAAGTVSGGHDPDELSAYALGMLDTEAATLVEAHLRHCDHCRADLRELREATDALDRLPVETFVHEPPDGDRALRAALHRIRRERNGGS